MRPGRRKRGRSGSASPPLRPSGTAPLPLPSALGADAGCSTTNRGISSAPFAPSGLLRGRPALHGNGDGYSQSSSAAAAAASIYAIRQSLLHMQGLQDLLRRTSLAEMRDREVVEWLLGTEQWLRQLHQPLHAGGARGADGSWSSAFPPGIHGDVLSNAYRIALSELRLLVLHVLHTMPWWRVVETVAGVPHVMGSAPGSGGGGSRRAALFAGGHSNGGGGAAGMAGKSSRGPAAAHGMDRALAARYAITRWHVRLQVAFERVCLLLIDQSQQTVRGVLEVLLKPCQLRPPVRDGARRSIPSDSFIRVLNAIATRYSPMYVVELLEGCIADFMPRRRWAERRHHVACTAVLLYMALEGHTPAYNPRLGNSQSLQRAVELLKSLRVRHPGLLSVETGGGAVPWALPHATGSVTTAGGGGTSEESGTDVSGRSAAASVAFPSSAHGRGLFPGAGGASSLAAMLPASGVLPSGYVSAALMEGARIGGTAALLRQPALPRPSPLGGAASALMTTMDATTTTATASDTEMSDASSARGRTAGHRAGAGVGWTSGVAGPSGGAPGLHGKEGSDSSAAAGRGRGVGSLADAAGRSTGTVAGQHSSESGAGGAVAVGSGAATASAAQQVPSFLDVTVAHNNKLLSHRNDIIRVLLNRLLDVEQTLEPLDPEGGFPAAAAGGGGSAASVMGGWAPLSTAASAVARMTELYGLGSAFGSPVASGGDSPAALFPTTPALTSALGSSSGFQASPARGSAAVVAASQTPTAASSMRSSPAALSPTAPPPLARRASSLSFGAAAAAVPALPSGSPSAPQPLEFQFNALSKPHLRILRDCTTLVYGRLADDLRRQQVAGSCGNADWWTDILFFYLTVVTRVERPVYLLYLAPSLALLGTEDEPVGLLHKLITLVVKGSMPVEQPRSSTAGGLGGGGGGGLGRPVVPAVQPVRLRMAPPTGSSRRVVTMEERLRAARHIFPLFHFLHSRIDEASGEGVRRRVLKWTAQELRRLGGGGGASSAGGTSGGSLYARSRLPPTRETRLALAAFAQCAAISELMDVDVVPPSSQQQQQQASGSKAARESTRFTSSSASGDASDGIAAALEPFLQRYTLQCEPPAEEQPEEDEAEPVAEAEVSDSAGASSASSSSSEAHVKHHRRKRVPPALVAVPDAEPRRRRIDLLQMEFEGLLQMQLMANCPWEAWLR